jgi:hypothetical protein
MDKRLLDLKKLCKKYDAVMTISGKAKHIKVVCNGRKTYVSKTPSDGNALKQVEKNLQQMTELK